MPELLSNITDKPRKTFYAHSSVFTSHSHGRIFMHLQFHMETRSKRLISYKKYLLPFQPLGNSEPGYVWSGDFHLNHLNVSPT